MTKALWAGLDVGTETVSICVIDDKGETVREATCLTSVKAVHRELKFLKRRRHARIGMEAGIGVAIARGLRALGYEVDVYEARQLSKFLRLKRNKTDAGDANGIAHAGRLGGPLISKVHVKTLDNQMIASRLTIRRHLVRSRVKATNLLCRQLELYGGRVKTSPCLKHFRTDVETQIRAAFGLSPSAISTELRYLLDHVEGLYERQDEIDRGLRALAIANEHCRRFMEIPGVGPICALTFFSAVGDPHRFTPSSDVGSFLGLTPKLHQSGLVERSGRISKMGNPAVRSLLVHSSTHFMLYKRHADERVRDWALRLAERRGKGKARVALARKLATIMIAMWKKGEPYRPEAWWRPAIAAPGALSPDLASLTRALETRGDGKEAGLRVYRLPFGPNKRCLFPGVRLPRARRRTKRGGPTDRREVASSNFVLVA